MEDLIKDPTSNETPPEKAGDSFASWNNQDSAQVPAQPPQTQPPEIPPEPSDQRERSQLGRKVADMERTFTNMNENLNRLTQLLAERETAGYDDPYAPPRERRRGPSEYSEPREEDIYDTPITTYRDVKEREKIEKRIEAGRDQAYVSNYVRRVKSLGIGPNTDPNLHQAIERELLSDGYNQYYRPTGHPVRDAEINYNMAKASVLEKKYRNDINRPNVQGDKNNAPAGMTSTGRVSFPPQQYEELDEYSKKFIKAVGSKDTDDWVQNSVKRKE